MDPVRGSARRTAEHFTASRQREGLESEADSEDGPGFPFQKSEGTAQALGLGRFGEQVRAAGDQDGVAGAIWELVRIIQSDSFPGMTADFNQTAEIPELPAAAIDEKNSKEIVGHFPELTSKAECWPATNPAALSPLDWIWT